MEFKSGHVLILFVLALTVCAVSIYVTVPEYINLEEGERIALEDRYNIREAEWLEFADDCNNYQKIIRAEEEEECGFEKSELVNRLSETNYELIKNNSEVVEQLVDINAVLFDLNRMVSDLNFSDLNCWR